MKSEHRHELKTNELAQWIASFPQWTRQNLKTIIYVSVVVVLVAGAYIYKRYQKNVVAVKKEVDFTSLILQLPQRKLQILQSQAQGLDTSYNLLQIADYLQASGQNTNNDAMAALAFIKEGDVLRMELHYRLETVSQQDLQKQIEKAKSCYEQAVEKASESPSLSARAKYGLAPCRRTWRLRPGTPNLQRYCRQSPIRRYCCNGSSRAPSQCNDRLPGKSNLQAVPDT